MKKSKLCITVLLLLFMGLFVLGCDLFSDDGNGIHIRTDKDHYIVETSVIRLSVENQSDRPVYYICTGQVWLQELSKNQVLNTWLVHGFEECLSRVPIEPGNSFAFELPLVFLDQRANGAKFDGGVRYQFEVDLYMDLELKQPLGEDDRLSNRFFIVKLTSL